MRNPIKVTESIEIIEDFKSQLMKRIDTGIKYADNIYQKGEKCIRLVKRYDCETCDQNRHFCKVWRKIIELSKQYHICQIIILLYKKIEQDSKLRQETIQLNLFKRR